nr:MAG TPA: hypothetical protein [Caudoviricetes sp.]
MICMTDFFGETYYWHMEHLLFSSKPYILHPLFFFFSSATINSKKSFS